MSRRTIGLLAAGLLVLVLVILSCSISQVLATMLSPSATAVPTRTPRPTWTRQQEGLAVATPTLDPTRFPVAHVPTVRAAIPTPQILIPGQPQPFVLPPGTPGQVMTVVVVIVTATPLPPAAVAPAAPVLAGTPQPTQTPGPPTPTATVTNTPPPPVFVQVAVAGALVRQGPGTNYAPLTKLDQNTKVTVVGRNRTGDWWKICCVNGSDVWIADDVVKVDGPLWTVPEVLNIPPSPVPTPTSAGSPTPSPTPTSSWQFRLEGQPLTYVLDQNYFRVAAVVYDGATPLWGYRLRIRKLTTGQEWLTDQTEAYWKYETIEWGHKTGETNTVVKRNVKWDSNGISVPLDNAAWDVTVTDGAGVPLSEPVRFNTTVNNSKWYYVVFTSRR